MRQTIYAEGHARHRSSNVILQNYMESKYLSVTQTIFLQRTQPYMQGSIFITSRPDYALIEIVSSEFNDLLLQISRCNYQCILIFINPHDQFTQMTNNFIYGDFEYGYIDN